MANLLVAGSAPYFEQKGELGELLYLFYNFPYVCEYRCKNCCSTDRPQPEGQLSEDELQGIIRQAADLGLRVFGIMGLGEPLISPGFEYSVKFAYDAGLIPYIFTTAFHLNERMADMLAENNASLIVHMDAFDPGNYHEICGGQSDLNTVLQNLEYAKTVFHTNEELDDNTVTRIGINMVVRKQNIDEIHDISEYCKRMGFAFVTNTLLDSSSPDYVSMEEIQERFPEQTTTQPYGTVDGTCAYLANGVTIQDGKRVVCPYLDTEVPGFKEGRLTPDLEIGEKFVSGLEQYGIERCYVRQLNTR